MTIWKPSNHFALTTWNFSPSKSSNSSSPPYLPLLIGEPVHIESECDDWYYGYSLADSKHSQSGIFPKSCATLQEYDTASRKYTFEQEVILTLHQWVNELKLNFVVSHFSCTPCTLTFHLNS